MVTKSEYGKTINGRYEMHHFENGRMIRDNPEGIYDDDCICPKCLYCDIQGDKCEKERFRYPTDGCFDFVDKNNPKGDNNLTSILKMLVRNE